MARRLALSCVGALATFLACGRVAHDTGGETNWLRCSVDEECPVGDICVEGRCTATPSTGGSAGNASGTGSAGDGSTTAGAAGVALGSCPSESSFATTDAPEWTADHSLVMITGEQRGAIVHSAVVGDLDADGYDDFVLVDPGNSGPQPSLDIQLRGAAYVFYGRQPFEGEPNDQAQGGAGGSPGSEVGAGGTPEPEPFPEPHTTLAADQADMIVRGVSGSASGLGDINGDGYDDFAFVTACSLDLDNCDPALNGVHVFYGGTGRYSGEWRADEIGSHWVAPALTWQVRPAGDVNGDGYADMLVDTGALQEPINPVTYLVLGRTEPLDDVTYDAVFERGEVGLTMGSAGTGDVDGDGYDDILLPVGEASCTAGGIALFYGAADRFSGTLSPAQADASFTGQAIWYITGAIGDLDGDGYDELALPSTMVNGASDFPGYVPVIYGRPNRFSGPYQIEQVMDFSLHPRASVDGLAACDLNGDGRRDLLLGDSKDETTGFQAGSLSVLRGSPQRLSGSFKVTSASALLYGQSDNETDLLGYGTSGGGDINGDGYDDALVGATGNHIGDEGGGRVFLILGAP